MKDIKKYFAIGLSLIICLGLSTVAFLHTMWLNVSDYSLEISSANLEARTKVYFGWGHRYPVDDFLSKEKLKDFCLISPDGSREKLSPHNGGLLATELIIKEPGVWIVSAIKKPVFYTMHFEKGEVHHKAEPKTGLKGVILSLYSEQYSKALINVGEAQDDSFLNSVGHRLEIIPLKNPKNLKVGDFLSVQVFFEGKPARYCKIYATYSGFSTDDDFACATTANGEGKARIRIQHYGPWLVKAKLKLPVTEELKDKCNELSYTSTLTFEVP